MEEGSSQWGREATKQSSELARTRSLAPRKHTRIPGRGTDWPYRSAGLPFREKEEQIKEEIKALETMDSSCLPDSLDEIPISEAEFSVRAVNALSRHQIQGASGHIEFKEPIKTIGQLAKISYEELCGITNLGMRTVKDIENVLFREYGIKLKRG